MLNRGTPFIIHSVYTCCLHPPRNGQKNQLTFLFKAFFRFFFANRIIHAVICIKMNFFSTKCFWLPR